MNAKLKIKYVDISCVSSDPGNVRLHDERNLLSIMSSLRAFGQQTPVVVDGRGIVLKGNGTLEAARRLGWDKIAVVETTLAGAEAIAYSVADNRTSDLSKFDDAALAAQLRGLESSLADVTVTGFTPDEIAKMLDDLASEALKQSLDEPDDDDEYDDDETPADADDLVKALTIAFDPQQFEEALSLINAIKSVEKTSSTGAVVLRALRKYAENNQ